MRPARLLLMLTVALVLAACDGVPPVGVADPPVSDASDPGAPPVSDASDPGLPPVSDASDPAGGTAPRAYTVEEAVAAGLQGSNLVTGFLNDPGDGWLLCSAIAESFPPQCGGTRLTVEGLDPADHDLQEASGVRWSEDATLYGEIDGDTFVVTGSAAAA